ncbi:MAG: 1-acyl-sn-glycerol-3-phosphate acyltransferase [Amoebophilaceae bacterium]|nr:1-acyl-sn-glycerol-3-phosphate acyltransferase [Amoebophilaceae bacterium]
MSAPQQFPLIKGKEENWPITKLHKNHKDFLTEVVCKSFKALRKRYPTDTDLYRILTQTISKELARIAEEPWNCDPKDDQSFWELMDHAVKNKIEAPKLLEKIIQRYVSEMQSSFSIFYYQCIAKSVHFLFVHLLKAYSINDEKTTTEGIFKFQKLSEKFQIAGEIQLLQTLATKGTLVLVPTHISNWDSVVLGLATKQLGLPPLSWGAGLNLFNNRGFRFIFSQLGTYKVDRRKKNIPYLQTQKDYTCLLLEKGCHMIFYPSGTRSRSGSIETDLKLGLLGTPLEAQIHNFQQDGPQADKFFIVPIALNYHCVLEAKQLIEESGLQTDITRTHTPNCCSTHLALSKNILCKGSEIFINIGMPLDVLGNRVDIEGNSYDSNDQAVDLYRQLMDLAAQPATLKPFNDWVKTLRNKIIATYYRINQVLSSHLVAFVSYELIQHSTEKIIIPYELFMATLAKVYDALLLLYKQKKIDFTPILLHSNLDVIAKDGVAKLGIYHIKKPLVITKNKEILVQDSCTLLYYHNRLIGYGLEKNITQ